MKLKTELAGEESIKKHLQDKQDSYVACFTNIDNLKFMNRELKKDMASKKEIEAMDKTIEEGNNDITGERDKQKQMHVIYEQQEAQIKDNEQAIKIYEKNIKFLQKFIK